jgi:RNA polymerase sigma-70 factor (ECF subfamily)
MMDLNAGRAPMTEAIDDTATILLVRQAAEGDDQAWSELLSRHRERLKGMVEVRMDRRLRGRIDPSDIIQEACFAAAQRLRDYAANPSMPFYLWLRWITGQRLVDQHRRHLGAKGRDAGRELALYHGAFPEATTADLAAHLLGRLSSPSQAAIRIEQTIRLQEALNALDPIDREILALRHFEQLTNGEAAEVLGLDKSAASKRYARALVRIKDILVTTLGTDG